jgi:hypothetical protein
MEGPITYTAYGLLCLLFVYAIVRLTVSAYFSEKENFIHRLANKVRNNNAQE